MGIRIRKILGWGLSDVKNFDSDSFAPEGDPRFNSENIYNHKDIDDFVEFLKDEKNINDVAEIINQVNNKCWDISRETYNLKLAPFLLKENPKLPNNICFEGSKITKSFVFCDPFDSEVYRYDDLMDNYDNSYTLKGTCVGMRDILKKLGCIYPYVTYLLIPGKEGVSLYFDDEIKKTLFPAEYSMLKGTWAKNRPPELSEDKLHILDNYRPDISPLVIAYIYWSEIFTNFEETIQQIRPMLLTTWR